MGQGILSAAQNKNVAGDIDIVQFAEMANSARGTRGKEEASCLWLRGSGVISDWRGIRRPEGECFSLLG